MKRNRTLIVMAVAVVTAGRGELRCVSGHSAMPVRQVEIGTVPVVVAEDGAAGRHAADGRPSEGRGLAGAHASAGRVRRSEGARRSRRHRHDRGERAGHAAQGGGAGASAPACRRSFPRGCGRCRCKVNEVIGVAGFVLPGTRVDVLVTVRDDGDERQPGSRWPAPS